VRGRASAVWGVVVLVAGPLLAAVPRAGAAGSLQLYVDGGCPVGGDGSAVAPCASAPGAPGPFRTIAAGIEALRPGSTLQVRGRHDAFDGVYREYLGIYGARHLDCRAERCTMRGYEGERPVLSGFKTYDDWRQTSPGSQVWFHDMERHDECQGLGLSGAQPARRNPDADWDPQIIVQDRRGDRVPLQYNDRVVDVKAPGPQPVDARTVEQRLRDDGSWWHDLAGHRSYVNPYGNGDPNRDPGTVLLVPQQQALIVMEGSGTCGADSSQASHNVLVKQLALEGARSKFVEVNGGMRERASDIRFEDLTMRFTGGKYAFHTQRVTHFSVENSLSEWIGRGLSWADHGHAFRTFQMDGATFTGITCRHLGTDNTGKRGFLDPPWANQPTSWWWGGTCIQVKQSNDVVLRNLVAEDLSLVAVALDVSRRTVLDGFDVRRAANAVGIREFTPMPATGCDERNEQHFCHNYDHVIRNGVIHATGIEGIGAIEIDPNDRDPHKKLQPDQFTAKIYNVAISYPGGAGVRVQGIDGVSVWNVSIFGDLATLLPHGMRPAKGILLVGDVDRFESRNNIFADLGDVAIDVQSPAKQGPSFDNDLFDLGDARLARWGADSFPALAGADGFQRTGQERHGRQGRPGFTRVPGSLLKPPDLHVAASSAAAGMGASLAKDFANDADGKPRRTWDAGAFVAGGSSALAGVPSHAAASTYHAPAIE